MRNEKTGGISAFSYVDIYCFYRSYVIRIPYIGFLRLILGYAHFIATFLKVKMLDCHSLKGSYI